MITSVPVTPQDAPPSQPQQFDNPCGTDGFEFVEYTAEDAGALHRLFESMGFTKVARHRSKDVALYRQGNINFIVNSEPDSRARQFARDHGPSACAMAFRVIDASIALTRAASLGAKEVKSDARAMALNIPAIEGIGGSLIYLVDRCSSPTIYDIDFISERGVDQNPGGAGLLVIDHLTHNVRKGRMDHFVDFYSRIFNFREIRYFDIKGEYTGLTSRALTAPCGKIRIPINESKAEEGSSKVHQLNKFILHYPVERIQHLALLTD